MTGDKHMTGEQLKIQNRTRLQNIPLGTLVEVNIINAQTRFSGYLTDTTDTNMDICNNYAGCKTLNYEDFRITSIKSSKGCGCRR